MPDLDEPPWSDIVAFLREEAIPVLTIVVVALIAIRLADLFVHGIVKHAAGSARRPKGPPRS